MSFFKLCPQCGSQWSMTNDKCLKCIIDAAASNLGPEITSQPTSATEAYYILESKYMQLASEDAPDCLTPTHSPHTRIFDMDVVDIVLDFGFRYWEAVA